MVLNKPDGEECGNCHFCTSCEFDREKEVSTGFLSSDIVVVHVEQFQCKRYPPLPKMRGYADTMGTNFSFFPDTVGSAVDKTGWCGEWRAREEEKQVASQLP